MGEGGKILATVLNELKDRTKIGTVTKEIDDWTRRFCLKYGVKASFLGYQNYPASICVSINDEVVHGIPGKRVIGDGDLVSLDLGIFHDNYHTDGAISFVVGKSNRSMDRLMEITKKSLELGIRAAKNGGYVGDIGYAIQTYVEENRYNVVRSLVGHGVGRQVHEDPFIPNFGLKGTGPKLKNGMTIAIEPMVTEGNYEVYQEDDGWTYKTDDGSLACHFEHTIYINDNEPIVLTKI